LAPGGIADRARRQSVAPVEPVIARADTVYECASYKARSTAQFRHVPPLLGKEPTPRANCEVECERSRPVAESESNLLEAAAPSDPVVRVARAVGVRTCTC